MDMDKAGSSEEATLPLPLALSPFGVLTVQGRVLHTLTLIVVCLCVWRPCRAVTISTEHAA